MFFVVCVLFWSDNSGVNWVMSIMLRGFIYYYYLLLFQPYLYFIAKEKIPTHRGSPKYDLADNSK